MNDERWLCAVEGKGYIHDWRLHERAPHEEYIPGTGDAISAPSIARMGYRDLWYCARCRLTEYRYVWTWESDG